MSETAETHPQRPMVFFKVGAMGGAPLHFTGLLAERLNAELYSSEKVRLMLREQRLSRDNWEEVQSSDIHARISQLAMPQLRAGKSVVLDMFFNSRTTRSRVPIPLARDTGSIAVALNLETPKDLIIQRVTRMINLDQAGMPMSEWNRLGKNPLQSAIQMYDNHTFAYIDEPGLDVALDIDGSANATEMIDEIAGKLALLDLEVN